MFEFDTAEDKTLAFGRTVEPLLTHTSRNPYTLITHTFWLLQNPNLHQN